MFAQSKGGNYSLTNGASGVADAIDFDGATDYLSRSSDLTGNADGKTFTFSAWVWPDNTNQNLIYQVDNGTALQFYVNIYSTGGVEVIGRNTAGTVILNASTSVSFPVRTFLHILVSVDIASTSNRAIYINDIAQTVTWTAYTNANINFTDSNHRVGRDELSNRLKGRLAHVYLDYAYRDLSVEANRRLFITADRKPAASQAALNPILYLPLDDPTTAHINEGTGGNFTLNGVVARSGRGPNQYNVAYSDLGGAADYLSRTTAPTGIADGKAFTFHCVFNADLNSGMCIAGFGDGANLRFRVVTAASGVINLYAANAAGTNILTASLPSGSYAIGRNIVLTASVDLSDTSKRGVCVNGSPVSVTWTTYTDANIDFTTSWYYFGQSDGNGVWFNGRLGDVFFDTKYIDLSVPANLAKFVTGTGIDAKPADLGANGEKPFGTAPLIYLPMYGNNAGKNYGTGGDFTVNSGPFTGARGPNEFWGNKAVFNGSTGRLNRATQLSGIADSKTLTFAFSVNKAASALYTLSDTAGATLRTTINASNQLVLLGKNSSGVTILSATVTTTISNATNTSVLVCVDLANASNRAVYLNNVAASVTWATYTNDSIDLTVADFSLGSEVAGANYLNGSLSEFYFTTDYIDFSQEANRLKFRDAFGNHVDLAPQIAAGTLPNPAIYMRFDPANFGKNDGTGGDFVVNGTITDGGQL